MGKKVLKKKKKKKKKKKLWAFFVTSGHLCYIKSLYDKVSLTSGAVPKIKIIFFGIFGPKIYIFKFWCISYFYIMPFPKITSLAPFEV